MATFQEAKNMALSLIEYSLMEIAEQICDLQAEVEERDERINKLEDQLFEESKNHE